MKEILVIENDSYVCKLLEKYLIENKYKPDTANNGKKALQNII